MSGKYALVVTLLLTLTAVGVRAIRIQTQSRYSMQELHVLAAAFLAICTVSLIMIAG